MTDSRTNTRTFSAVFLPNQLHQFKQRRVLNVDHILLIFERQFITKHLPV